MNMNVTVTPAYGRDYKDGKPINKPQADEAGLTVTLRYSNLRKTCQAEGV